MEGDSALSILLDPAILQSLREIGCNIDDDAKLQSLTPGM